MRNNLVILGAVIACCCILFGLVYGAPQAGNDALVSSNIDRLTYDATLGAQQVTILDSRAISTPQTGNDALVSTTIDQLTYDATLGARQVIIVGSTGFLEAIFTPTPQPWQILQIVDNDGKVSNFSNLNLEHGGTPSVTLYNTTESDVETVRNQLIFKAEQSGGEVYEQAVLSVGHSGTADDQKANVTLQPTEDSTDFFQLLDADGGDPVLSVDTANERVGIGEADSSEKLHISGSSPAIVIEDIDTAGNQVLFHMSNTLGPMIMSYTDSSNLSTKNVAASRIQLNNDSFVVQVSPSAAAPGVSRSWGTAIKTKVATFDTGIGENNPQRRLHVTDSAGDQLRIGTTETVYTEFDSDSNGDTTITNTGDETLIDSFLYHNGTYAEIYTHDNSTATAVATGSTYTKFDQWGVNGLSSNATADQANDKITITHAGKYSVNGAFSMQSGTANIVLLGAAFLGGVEQDQLHFQRKISTAGDVGAASFVGFVNATSVPVDLDFRMRHDNAGSIDITVIYANLDIRYLGE